MSDAGSPGDAGGTDAGTPSDAGRPDAGTDAGSNLDAGRPDAGIDAGSALDAGRPDSGADAGSNIEQVSIDERHDDSAAMLFSILVRDRKQLAQVIRSIRRMKVVKKLSRTCT